MQVRTFMAKLSTENVRNMDETMNQWLSENKVEPRFVCQTFCYGHHHEVSAQEPVLVTSVWY